MAKGSYNACVFAVLVAAAAGLRARVPAQEEPWPTMRGPLLHQFGSSDIVAPKNLSASLLWKWHHPDGRYNTNIAGGPVIDAGLNLYVCTNDGVRKLSPQGSVLWHFPQPTRKFNNQVALYGGAVFGCTEEGVAFALDKETGIPRWEQKLAQDAGGDAGYPAAYDGVFVVAAKQGTDKRNPGGNQVIFGLDVETGKQLWEFGVERPVWNFEPLFPGDGNVVFMDFTGAMYSLGLHTGRLNWHESGKGQGSFTDGGPTLGPDGKVFACSNPATTHGEEGGAGLLRALRVSDGTEVWTQELPQPCNSYPAVGKLGNGPELSVVVTPGSFMGSPRLHGSIMAFDASTGQPQWRMNTLPFTGLFNMAKGDIEGYEVRRKTNPRHAICLPAHWSSANIAGDGTVFAGRSDGYIYAVHAPEVLPPIIDAEKPTVNFASTSGLDVNVWNADGAFLHGAFAFAPGMVAVATCDTLYVFKS